MTRGDCINLLRIPCCYMAGSPGVRVLTVDDHPLIREGLVAVLGREGDLQVVGEAVNGQEAVERFRELRPDIVLMDLQMPLMDGVAATKAIVAEFPGARVIVLSTYDGDEDIHRALAAGAKGYVLKDMVRATLLTVIRQVLSGDRGIPADIASRLAEFTPRIQLTNRECEVLQYMAKGFSNREIAGFIGREESTVKAHVKSIMLKLDVHDRTEATVVGAQRGFVRID